MLTSETEQVIRSRTSTARDKRRTDEVVLGLTEDSKGRSSRATGGVCRFHRVGAVWRCQQPPDRHEEYIGRRGLTSKAVGSVADDAEGRDLYLGYAREDRCALWLRLPDEAEVAKALRVLADHQYLHTRYYGSKRQTDFHISWRTSIRSAKGPR